MADSTRSSGRNGGSGGGNKSRGRGGTVEQSFSRGRSKQVVVQTKKKRLVGAPGSVNAGKPTPGASGAGAGAGGNTGGVSGAARRASAEGKAAKTANSGGGKYPPQVVAAAKRLGITVEELIRRKRVLDQQKAQQAEQAKKNAAAQESQQRLANQQRAKVQEEKEREEADARRKAEEEARKAEEARAAAREKEDARPGGKRPAPGGSAPLANPADLEAAAARGKRGRGGRDDRDRGSSRPRSGGRERRRGKLTIASALGDDGDRQRSLASVRRARERERERRETGDEQREKVSLEVKLPETITLQDLAGRMKERVADVVKYMIRQGEMMRGNDIVDADTAEVIAVEFGHTVKRVSESDVEIGLEGEEDAPEDMKPRPPVVTIMGHVDHGKTSLLDALRSTDTVSGESGGITQHIGAYQVQLASEQKITFLDTPGHAAFTAMRARGANATDIAVLVVAADDSVMPQTIESISHAKAAGVPIIVAVNKIDVAGADPDKVLTDLLQHDIQVESMGGDVQAVKVSALEKQGLDELTEAITLQAELLELAANPDREADGVVVESQLDKGRGPVSTVLVKRGTLKRGDIVVAGAQWGKVRALVNERGKQLKGAAPSTPVEVLGLDGAPDPGDPFYVVPTEARAREVTEYRQRERRRAKGKASVAARASLDQLLATLKDDAVEVSELPVVVKGDVQGSVEAIDHAMTNVSTEEVKAVMIHGAVGGISESDVQLAKASEAPIFAFNVRANKQARDLAEREGVEIRYYSVIYDLIDDVRSTLSGMLSPEKRENFLGYAEILEVFDITKVGKVAGCRVTEGKVLRGCGVRLLRDDVVIHEGKLRTLKRFKDEVSEVSSGMECGMAFERYEDIRVGDRIECFEVEEVARTLDS